MLHIPSDDINKTENLSEYWQAFIDFCIEKNIDGIERWELWKACLNIEETHTWRKRFTWEDYTQHLYDVARNYINIHSDTKYITAEEIYATLNHDNIEDTDDTFDTLKTAYWEIVALIVQVVSKHTWLDNYDKRLRDNEYISRFQSIAFLQKHIEEEAIIRWIVLKPYESLKLATIAIKLKWCDRNHNLATEICISIKRAEHKRKQTIEDLLPVIKQVGNTRLTEGISQTIEQVWEDIRISIERGCVVATICD